MSGKHGHGKGHSIHESHEHENHSVEKSKPSLAEINAKLPYWQRHYWWRPWALLIMIVFNAFVWKAPFEYHFLFMLPVIFIWGGFSWLSAIAYATMIIPGYFSPAYGWVSLYAFLILLGLLCIMQIIQGFLGIGKELSLGIGEEMENAEPTPPKQHQWEKMVTKTAKAIGSPMGGGQYKGGNPFSKFVHAIEESTEQFFEFFGGGEHH